MRRATGIRILEGLFILLSIMLSFYLEDLRQDRQEVAKKDELLEDLAVSVREDMDQIAALEQTLRDSLVCIGQLQDDIAADHSLLSDEQAIERVPCMEIGHSFFPKDGVYAQLVATGGLELIDNPELKSLILEVYTHHRARNYATSTEIDYFNIQFRKAMLTHFRIRFNYDSKDGVFYGSKKLASSQFNSTYYQSDEFFGLIGQATLYANMYLRQLDDIKKTYGRISQGLAARPND